MFSDEPLVSEPQSIPSCCECSESKLGIDEADTSSGQQVQHQQQMQASSSRVTSENCIENAMDANDPQLKDNSPNRYTNESPQAPAWNATQSQAALSEHFNMDSQLPQSAHTWPANEQLPQQNPNVSQPNSSNHLTLPRTYGSPILEQQQRPTILVIVVNKPGLEKPINVYAPVGNYQATTKSYSIHGRQDGYAAGAYNTAASHPIADYQKGGYNSVDPTRLNNSGSDNGQNQNSPAGSNAKGFEPSIKSDKPIISSSEQAPRQMCDCCTCTAEDGIDVENGNESNSGVEWVCNCDCDNEELKKTLEGLIPNEECLYYLANLASKKKRKKRKPRSVFDRFENPPFVIEPKPHPNPTCCMCGFCNSRCCYGCCNNCCNSCYPWC